MNDEDLERTQAEIDRLLNDPETPLHPDRIWELAAYLAATASRAGD
jgi:hypothetical protein